MKYLTEFRNGEIAQRIAREIHSVTTRPWKIMEVCGGQTHSIIKNGIDQMLPAGIEMIHGPGCPVCVTPLELIDKALAIAAQPDVIFCSFGDMLRVPGTDADLFQIKGAGGDVRVVYSPLDAVDLAVKHPDKQVVFFGVGFETTAPANAMSVHVAKRRGLKNFSVLISHVLVPPAIEAILQSPGNQVQGFLLAGHVCSVMGYWQYPPLAEKYQIPLVVTGFEPLDLLDGIRRTVLQLEQGRHEVENAYSRVVTFDGNISRVRRRRAVPDHRHPHSGVAPLPLRRRPSRGHQARRVLRLWQRVHPAPSPRRHHGFKRRRLRRLLQLRPLHLTGATSRRGQSTDHANSVILSERGPGAFQPGGGESKDPQLFFSLHYNPDAGQLAS